MANENQGNKNTEDQLRANLQELDKIARQLVRRDMELSQVREKQEAQMLEMDRIAKMLVRRDFELLQANEMLRELDAAKSQFVSVAAHQLRTPLSGIKWIFKMMLSGDYGTVSEEQKEVLGRGYQMVVRLISLVSDLLDVARIESGKIEYCFKDDDLAVIVKGLIQEQEKIIKEEGLNIQIAAEYGVESLVINADKDRLAMALRNILDNAVKYSPDGGGIKVFVGAEGGMATIRIKDGGLGIKETDIPKLFTKFFRGENVARGQISGTGLGLFVVKSIIDAHEGKIEVESKEGGGTEFIVRLPFDRKRGQVLASSALYTR